MHETVWGTVVNGGSKLKPQRHLFNQGVVACVTFMVPVFFVLYFITVPRGQWIPVVAGQVIVNVLFVLAAVAFFRVGIWVGPDGITERGFFGQVNTVDLAYVGSELFVVQIG